MELISYPFPTQKLSNFVTQNLFKIFLQKTFHNFSYKKGVSNFDFLQD
jgi:hypothetical protein